MYKLYTLDNEFIKEVDYRPNNFTGIIIYSDGTKEWFLNGKTHRLDGLAYECSNGTKCWYFNGQLHREDGPAIEYTDGTKYWYLNGKKVSKEQHKLYVDIMKLKGLL